MDWRIIVLICIQLRSVHLKLLDPHPDIDLTIEEVLTKYGYPMEKHHVETEDGYLLTTYRIPHGKNSTKIGTPILFVPGTGGSAENFLILGIESAISYYLADRGFDLWLMNQRGTTHSRKHKTLDAETDPSYWDFSWHEVGIYDIPANIDYILNVTKKEKLFYIGHSQGTTTYFVLTAARPEYNDKLIAGVEFGLSIYLKNLNVPLMDFVAKYHRFIENILKILNIHYIIPDNEEVLSSLKEFCSLTNATAALCGQILNLLGMEENEFMRFNNSYTSIIFRDSPAGSSVKQLIHYFQIADSGIFRQYDYGKNGNMKKYNSEYPPIYNLSYCTAPVVILEARGDFEITDETRVRIKKELPNIVYYHQIPDDHFHHADYLWGNNVMELVNIPVYRILKRLDNKRI